MILTALYKVLKVECNFSSLISKKRKLPLEKRYKTKLYYFYHIKHLLVKGNFMLVSIFLEKNQSRSSERLVLPYSRGDLIEFKFSP